MWSRSVLGTGHLHRRPANAGEGADLHPHAQSREAAGTEARPMPLDTALDLILMVMFVTLCDVRLVLLLVQVRISVITAKTRLLASTPFAMHQSSQQMKQESDQSSQIGREEGDRMWTLRQARGRDRAPISRTGKRRVARHPFRRATPRVKRRERHSHVAGRKARFSPSATRWSLPLLSLCCRLATLPATRGKSMCVVESSMPCSSIIFRCTSKQCR